MDSIVCIGLNHETAKVEDRERLAILEGDLPEFGRALCKVDPITETVVLSTCNRTEIYAASTAGADPIEAFLRNYFNLQPDDIQFYQKAKTEAVQHLFRVSSGLDSMVLGETEIFGQIKKAYSTALEAGTTSRHLNRLFQQAFQVGKHVRHNSNITRGSTSVGSVAVDLAEKIFGNLGECNVMVIGAGEINQRTARSLHSRGATGIIVSNRSFDKAERLAAELNGSAIRFDDYPQKIPQTDIIITSTGAPHAIIHPETINAAMKQRRGKPLFIIDIAVPRDVEPSVADHPSVYLYDLDSLEKIASQGREQRREQIKHCDQLIAEMMEKLKLIPRTAPQGDTYLEGDAPSSPRVQ
ncbi:MAG: glutamyl-tRNA reductase [Verrucomicrobiales bacterium]